MASDRVPEPQLTVRDAPERGRYELFEDDELVGFAEYRDGDGGAVVMPHTVVDASRRGRGYGDVLVGAAVQRFRSEGREIVPVCWFVADYIGRHPDR